TMGLRLFRSFTITSFPMHPAGTWRSTWTRRASQGGPSSSSAVGTGRVLIPTARAGVEIVGIDASEGMLEACRRRLRAESPDVQQRASLQRGDMRDFELGRMFRLVTIPFRPFQHLVMVQEQLACLAAIRRPWRHSPPVGCAATRYRQDRFPRGTL